ncbi:hypothetical protein CYMTET_28377 [Cymbomonas tetramitiformis]|uniref:DUF819 family protein n=1 Tax=Cymbomonas tetramitiformis TaxID=36881 RepID=A0AAE0KW03_9CHLO|nr:hypothetical protein CYMTET_28377 [Cymbomonas tetramitiformis]
MVKRMTVDSRWRNRYQPAVLRGRGSNFARSRSKTWRSLNSIALGSEEIIVASLLGGCITIGQYLATQTKWGERLTSPLVIMLLAMALSASGLLPPESGVYAMVWDLVMPLGVALSLLGTDLRHLVRDAGVTLMAFAFGALGTVLGTVVGWAITGPGLLGPEGWKVAAALCASYIGGSVNFASTAKALGLGATAAGESLIPSAMAADNLAMGIFLLVLIAVAKGDASSTQPISQPADQTTSSESLPPPTIRVRASLLASRVARTRLGARPLCHQPSLPC